MLVRTWRKAPVLAVVLGVWALGGCRKNLTGTDLPNAGGGTAGLPGPEAPAATAPTPTSAQGAPGASGDPAAPGSFAAPGELGPACGDDGKPECPLQHWMDENMSASMTTKSGPRLAEGFAYLATLDPPGYPQWRALAELGREAANRGDFGAAKRICSACHDQYRPRFRAEPQRRRPLPPPLPPPSSPP